MSRRILLGRIAPLGAVIIAIAAVLAVVRSGDDGAAARTKTAKPAAGAAAPKLASRSDLRPPRIEIRRSRPGQARGLIFVAPKKVFGPKPIPGEQHGLEIVDSKGRVRYFKPNSGRDKANNFQVQRYQGKPVLTYWYGHQANGTGKGVGVILDEHYRRIATVHAGNGLEADFHAFKLTPQGTALLLAYHPTRSNGKQVVEGVMQEIDVKTGKVLTEWSSLGDVPVSNSYESPGDRSSAKFDYIHLNSADIDTDGNILVSARHTWAIYKIQRHTGKLLWTLGGKASDFKMGPGAQTAWQHDAVSVGRNLLSVFDNGAGDSGARKLRSYSRVAYIRLDPKRKTARLVKARKHPSGLSAGTQANGQQLANGDLFVGWGSKGVFSEFTAGGRMLFDARVPDHNDSYRAYRFPWTGIPSRAPSAVASVRGSRIVARASWNGSTQVRAWRLLTGSRKDQLRPTGRTAWKDLETAISVPDRGAKYVAAQALGRSDKVLATSPVRAIKR